MKRLPASYVKIVDNEEQAALDPESVVVHYQASRLLGKIVDGEVVSCLVDGLTSKELKEIRTT
jgi:hypothetical protein